MAKADYTCPQCLVTEERPIGAAQYLCNTCNVPMRRRWHTAAIIIK